MSTSPSRITQAKVPRSPWRMTVSPAGKAAKPQRAATARNEGGSNRPKIGCSARTCSISSTGGASAGCCGSVTRMRLRPATRRWRDHASTAPPMPEPIATAADQSMLLPRLISAAAFAEFLSPLPQPALDTLALPGRRGIEAVLQLADPLAQPAAALPITLGRDDVGNRRTMFRDNRARLRGNRDRGHGAEQQGDEKAGLQHDAPRLGCGSHYNGNDRLIFLEAAHGCASRRRALPETPATRRGADRTSPYSQNAITIMLLASSTRLMRFGLCTMPATPCVGTIVRKPRGRSSSRTTLAVPAGALPFSANFLPMHCLQSSALTVVWAVPGICLTSSA